MSRVFVIGAGFSKAIADAPLANELFSAIYLEANKDKDEIGNTKGLWQNDHDNFLKVVSHLDDERNPWINHFKLNNWPIETYGGLPHLYPINIEYLCTIIDLNIKHPFAPKGKGIDLSLCQVPYMGGLTVKELKHARDFITFYIVKLLLPDRLTPDHDLLDKKLSLVSPGDVVIDFNYDLLVEQGLWKKGLWTPSNGYGVGKIQKQEKIEPINLAESKVLVIKPHGSVNWAAFRAEWQEEIEIYTTHPFTNVPLFEGLRVKSERLIPENKYRHTSHVILPTYMKGIKRYWETQLLKLACEAVSKADEIFILGYSFPEADAMANFIFAQIPSNARIKIVDIGDSTDLAYRLGKKYGLKRDNILRYKKDIKEYDDQSISCEDEFAQGKKELEELWGPMEEPNW